MWSIRSIPVASGGCRGDGLEVGEPAVGLPLGGAVAEEDRGAVGRGHRRQVGFARSAPAHEHRRASSASARSRRAPGSALSTRERGDAAARRGPGVEENANASCCHSSTGLVRCAPTSAKPIARSNP